MNKPPIVKQRFAPGVWPIKIVVKPGSSQTGLTKPHAVVVTRGAFYWR